MGCMWVAPNNPCRFSHPRGFASVAMGVWFPYKNNTTKEAVMATQYKITTNGVEMDARFASKARAIAEGEKISTVAQERGEGDVITVQTVKTHKVVWTYTAPESNVTIAGSEPNTWAPDFDSQGASECFFGCGQKVTGAWLTDAGVTEGVCAEHTDMIASRGRAIHPVPVAEVSPVGIPVAGVIQAGQGMMGTTHYHAAACADVKREMGKWGQSEDDVIRFPFSSVAEIIDNEFSDVENGNWADMMSHATDAIRIMPCLSNLPAGRTPSGPLVIHGNVFCEGLDIPPLCAWKANDAHMACEAGEYIGQDMYGSVQVANHGDVCEFHSDEMNQDTPGFPIVPDKADGPMTGQYDDYNYAADGGFVETMVTKEYHLAVCVDDITGATVDLGWHTLTLNAAQAHDVTAIADAYAKINGSGKPRHGWASVIDVIEICDI